MAKKSDENAILFVDNIEAIAIDKLIPWPKNPRNNEMAIEPVALSIKTYGMLVPILINKKNEIIAGNTRFLACRDILKLKKVPCVRAEHLSKEQQEMFNIADNKLSEIATWNQDMLREVLTGLQTKYEQKFNPELLGMQQAEIELIFKGWESSAQRVGDVDSDDSPAPGKIVITCLNEDEDNLKEALNTFIAETGFKGVTVK